MASTLKEVQLREIRIVWETIRKEHEGMTDEMLHYLVHMIITMRNRKGQKLVWARHRGDFITEI